MTATILDGREAAHQLLLVTAGHSEAFRSLRGRRPRLVVVTGDAAGASSAYLDRIAASADVAGIEVGKTSLTTGLTTGDAVATFAALNAETGIDGILPLLPLPGLTPTAVAGLLAPDKDVDGLTPLNLGRLACGLPGLRPCTPQAAIRLAETALGDLRGRIATVVGASAHVGQALATLLVQRGVTVTIGHIDTPDLAAACRQAEILFVAAGVPGLIRARHLAEGATVIDIGVNLIQDEDGRRVVGDVLAAEAASVARFLSAVPDGVGPLTTAFLMANTASAAAARYAESEK